MPEYHFQLSKDDDLLVSFETKRRKKQKAEVASFCLTYRTSVDGCWKEVLRFDNAHGDPPHQHVFDRQGAVRKVILGRQEDTEKIFLAAHAKIKKNFQSYKQQFLQE